MLGETFEALRACLLANEPVAVATLIDASIDSERSPGDVDDEVRRKVTPGSSMLVRRDGPLIGSLGSRGLDRSVHRDAIGHLTSGLTAVRHYGANGEMRQQEVAVFIETFAPPPRMLIFGAVDFSAALARVAKILGYRVTVCDARPAFATTVRFPMADEVVADWPDRYLAKAGTTLGPRDAICVLTHDLKFDVPTLRAALGTDAGYIGAMGSRRTTSEREARLRDAGVSESELSRVMAPMGLDIGARTTEETAVSICAEIIASRSRGRTGSSLRSLRGAIHDRPGI